MNDLAKQATRLWTVALPTVSAFVGALVRDTQTRDDILQETAIALIESFDRYDSEKPFVGWAIGIARNQVRLHQRRVARSHLIFDSEAIESLAQSFTQNSATTNAKLDRLGECIQTLDVKSRDLCRLRYENDLKPAAIGEKIGLTANTVAKALQRIRDRLRDCIERRHLASEVQS